MFARSLIPLIVRVGNSLRANKILLIGGKSVFDSNQIAIKDRTLGPSDLRKCFMKLAHGCVALPKTFSPHVQSGKASCMCTLKKNM